MNVFLSSTVAGLQDARASLSEQLTARSGGRFLIVSYETHRHRHPMLSPEETCLELVRGCQALIVLVDQYYGAALTADPTISITHAEVREAQKQGLVVIPVVRTQTWHEFFVWRLNKGAQVRFHHVQDSKLFELLDELYATRNCHVYDNLTGDEALQKIAETLDAILSHGSTGKIEHVTLAP